MAGPGTGERTFQAAVRDDHLARRGLLLLAALLVLASIFAARADAYIYWANSNLAETEGTIGRANLDGTGVDQSFIPDATGGVAVDGAHVYWTNNAGTIGRANLDGTGVDQSFITYQRNPALDSPISVEVDGAHVYWVNINVAPGPCLECAPQTTGTIWRANLDGTGVESLISGVADSGIFGLAVDGAHIYWANIGTIGRANLDGTGVDQTFITSRGAAGVAVDGAHVYWVNSFIGSIGRANLDGTSVDQKFITGASDPIGAAVDGAHVYWTTSGRKFGTGTIGRANVDGTGVTQRLITGPPPTEVAVDALGPPPSNKFRLDKAKRNKKWGSAKLRVKVAGPGELELAKTGSVKGQHERAEQSGQEKLAIEPKGKAKKKLNRKGKAKAKVKVKAEVTYTPDGGEPNTQSKKIKLVKR